MVLIMASTVWIQTDDGKVCAPGTSQERIKKKFQKGRGSMNLRSIERVTMSPWKETRYSNESCTRFYKQKHIRMTNCLKCSELMPPSSSVTEMRVSGNW